LGENDAEIGEVDFKVVAEDFLVGAEGIPNNDFEDFGEETAVEVDAGELASVLVRETLVQFRSLEVFLELDCGVRAFIGIA
jgi:hypothetical protein